MENNNTKPRKIKFKILISLALAVGIAISFVLGYFTFYWAMDDTAKHLYQIVKLTDKNYYGETSVDKSHYADVLVKEVFDEYSDYYTASEYDEIKNQASGNYVGVGVTFLTKSDKNSIYGVIGNSPAEKAGLVAGDEIVGGINVKNGSCTFEEKQAVLDFLSSVELNETFTLYVTREGEFANKEFTITKSAYVTTFVKYYDNQKFFSFRSTELSGTPQGRSEDSSVMSFLPSDTAYITFDSFEGELANELEQALKFMRDRGKTKLILDLADNGGGYMSVLSSVCAHLLKSDKLNPIIAYSKQKDGDVRAYCSADLKTHALPEIVIIANENTASASECLIGAMHYYNSSSSDKLVIIKNEQGKARTFGKGIMQTTYSLSGGGAVKFTTAGLFQPDGTTSINGVGFVAEGANAVDNKTLALERAVQILS